MQQGSQVMVLVSLVSDKEVEVLVRDWEVEE
jgi:hypothetical protein